MANKLSKSKKPRLNRRLIGIALPLLVVGAWLGAAGVGGPYFGRIEEVSSNDPATFLPASAESTEVNERIKDFRDSSTVPAIVVFESDSELSDQQIESIESVRDDVEETSIPADNISPLIRSEDDKAAFLLIPIDSEAEFDKVVPELQQVVKDADSGLEYSFTGPALFSRDLQAAFAGIDGTLLVVALSVVFVILLLIYRSPVLPIVTLLGSLSALAAAILVVFYLAEAGIVQLNGQVQGILFILVIGAATDYSLLYIARYREELTRHKDKLQATIATWKASFEPILAAGGTVTLGLFCLLASDLGSNKALGPVGGIGILLAILVTLTYLPAVLLLFGRTAFWPRRPAYKSSKLTDDDVVTHAAWEKVATLISRHPRRIWVGTMVALLIACAFLPQFRAVGVSQDNFILGPSDARDGQDMLNRHFAEGSGTPAYIIVPESDQDQVAELIEADKSVESVSIVSDSDKIPSIPLGEEAAQLRSDIETEVEAGLASQKKQIRKALELQMAGVPDFVIDEAYLQAIANIPSVSELASKIDPFKDIDKKVVSGNVLLEATLTDPASSVEARETIQRLRDVVHKSYPDVKFGGVSAVQLDTNTASDRDLIVVIPLILLAITVVLMFLLRSIVAPLILVLTTVISFAATLGIAALLFNNVWQFPGADPAVIIFGFVFLVALGIDYNIFLMTRVREETQKHGVREGTLRALVVTGGVITSAGVVLAATFASLFVIPILFLAQIAFIVAFGVLLDTLIVRSLLVPALTLEIGRKMWWPSQLSKRGKK